MARVQLLHAWVVSLPIDEVRQRVRIFLARHNMKIISERTGEITELVADQGSQLATRFKGTLIAEPSELPKRARVRTEATSQGVRVEAVIEEALGVGWLDPLSKKRYQEYFQQWIDSLSQTLDVQPSALPRGIVTPEVQPRLGQFDFVIHLNPDIERIQAAAEVVRVPVGVTIRVKRSRTIEYTISIDWTASGEASLDLGIKQWLNATLRGQIEQRRGRSYQQSETVEYEVELSGNQSNQYTLTWIDSWAKGVVEVRNSLRTEVVPFKFREQTELQVLPS